MINAEQIYKKAQSLDNFELQELADFTDFLLTKKNIVNKRKLIFKETQLEDLNVTPIYNGKTLTLEEMDEVINWEAGQK